MNNNLKFGALGIAVLFVFAMVALPGSADEIRPAIDDLTVPAGSSCELVLGGPTTCTSAAYDHNGGSPALNVPLLAEGVFTVRIQETCCPDYWIEQTFTVALGGAPVGGPITTGPWGAPWTNFEVQVHGEVVSGNPLIVVQATHT